MFGGSLLCRRMGTLTASQGLVKDKLKKRVAPTLSDIPGPYAFPLVGVLPHYLPLPGIGKYDPKRILKASMDKYQEFGPIFKETLFGSTLVYLVNPDDMQTVLRKRGEDNWPKRVTHMALEHVRTHELSRWHHNGGIFMVNGEDWAVIRHRHQKAMSLDEIGKFIPKCDELALKLISQLDSSPMMKQHVDRDFLNVFFSYASDYMGMILFGEEWNSIQNCLDPSSITYKLIWSSTELNHATGPTDHGAQMWRHFSTPLYKTILKGAAILDEVVIQRLDSRLEKGKLKPKDTDSLLDTWIRDGHQDYRQLLTLLSDLMLAGIDTVAYSLSFVIYHLSVTPAAQESLYKELQSLAPELNMKNITPEMLGSASYMKKCVKEALRLNPLAVGIGRVVTEDTLLSGYLVPEGTSVVTLNQVASRLPEYVESPDAFIPERYNVDGAFKRIHPYVSIPFSHGPRSCVGRRLAEQNMNIFLFRLFRNYQVEWIGTNPLDCITSLINKPDAPLLFKFTPRRN